jgi:predicted Zn-dependent protease
MFTIRSFGGRLARGRALMRSALPAALLAAGLAGCQSAPETGRSQMLLLSTAEENQLGESAYAEMLAGAKTLTSGADFARHGGERMSRAMAVEIAAGILNETGQVNPELVDGVLAGYGALGETAFSRNEEAEADQIGIMIAADAGYDPRAAVTFWKKMSALGGAKPPEFLATHPSDEKRASRLEALMPRALTVYEAAKQAGR